MVKTGFESRVKVQQIIDNQLPEFILDESPKAVEFLKQYYISQEYQGGPIDISENIDQYLKLDSLIPESIIGFTILSANISSTSDTIFVSSTKGFPQKYGLLKINDEIITYTDKTTNSFTGCIRGFSGITNYHKTLDQEELVFSTSSADSHISSTTVENLSSLFLQEFYKKIKFTLTPELENNNFVSDLNVGNFIKEARTLYQTKGTEESFRILFNVLFGETPKVINLENFLIKPSSANYIRRLVVVADLISGNPLKIEGQTLFKKNDSNTTASISEVEVIKRKDKIYYKLLLFIGYDDAFPPITGQFSITGSTRVIETGDSVITVDSTIGFPETGILYFGNNKITYSSKSVNQFFGCVGIEDIEIPTASLIFSDDTYYSYENGDITKEVKLRLTGVLSGYDPLSNDSIINVGDEISVKNLGKSINNPVTDKTYKELFANTWIYNTSTRYEVASFTGGSQFILKSNPDKSSLKVGDSIDILEHNTQEIATNEVSPYNKLENLSISAIDGNQITTSEGFQVSSSYRYDIRRKIKNAISSSVSLEFNPIVSDVQNVYDANDYMYVASNSFPSYEITQPIFSYNAVEVEDKDSFTNLYSKIVFDEKVSFITGSEIYYQPSDNPIPGLSKGVYFVQVVPDSGNLKIRLYASRSVIGTNDCVQFGELTEGTHNFTLNSQKEKVLSPQKILRKFPLSVNIGDGQSDLTTPGPIGMLINGVEIFSYKTNNKVYYGPLEKINVLNPGNGYDVINPPILSLSSGSALVEPIISGSVEKINLNSKDFDVDVVVSVAFTGGNGFGAVFEPVIERKRKEIEFDARETTSGGGVDIVNETITFLTEHNLIDGQQIVYRCGDNPSIGIETFKGLNINTGNTLKNESSYYTKFVSTKTIQLYPSLSDFRSGINTIGFSGFGNSGIQKFVTEVKNTLKEIKVINGGSNYTHRKLRVLPSGISTSYDLIEYTNHGFNDGELVRYTNTGTLIVGLSTAEQYYVLKLDDNKFRLASAGIGATITSNYTRRKYVSLKSIGSGYHIFNYPEITLKVEYNSVGLTTSQYKGVIDATPIVRGKIIDAYVYQKGSDYGSDILNYHKKPSISIKNGKNASLKPIIINGQIIDVAIQYGGDEYYSMPDLEVVSISGSGNGAIINPILVNKKITGVNIVNSGAGYSANDTFIKVVPAGKNVFLDCEVRSLNINNNVLYKNIDNISPTDEIIISSGKNLQYGVCGYSELIKNEFNDNEDPPQHSPIIGWAYDGNPIYGSFGYVNPKDKNSGVKRLQTGYILNPSQITNRPTGFSEGFFIEDYSYNNSGDLDEYNGRFCVTPEFPDGIYAYFATSIINQNNEIIGSFPYFVGNRYRSKFVSDNKKLNQSFDFNNSSLIRNTFPYKLNEKYANNDFLIESNEVINQISVVQSVTSASIDQFDIINPGDNYKVGDDVNFDESNTGGGGLIVKVSEIEGKKITNLNTEITSYDDAVFTWDSGSKVKVKITPHHDLENLDYINISGFSTNLGSLNGFQQVGVTTYSAVLIKDVPSYSLAGVVTDIYISNIPDSISVGSSIKIESETLPILNIFKTQNVVRVVRQATGSAHTATTPIYFLCDTFTIDKELNYFDSSVNDLVYFNPQYSIGFGTVSGIGSETTYNVGIQTDNTISVPTQTIFIPNHPFKTNQKVTLSKLSNSSAISVANTSGGPTFNLPRSGNSQTVYIIKKSSDYIGIVTQIGLTSTSNGLFFTSFIPNNPYDYQYSLQSNFIQVKGNIKKNKSTVSVSTSHELKYGDIVNLSVKPNLSVGIGTSTFIKVIRDLNTNFILINPIGITSANIDIEKNIININDHGLKTGDKVKYSANQVASGLTTGFYFVYKVDDNNIKLSETYNDSALTNPPNTVSIGSSGGSSQNISLVNPKITIIRNNDLVFSLSDSSLTGYNFKLFYDQLFKDEFISTGSTIAFSITGVGTPGITTNASSTLNYHDDLPNSLFYCLEKSGYISTSDLDVKNYSEITFTDSVYNGSYKISNVNDTTFTISLENSPEKISYTSSQCETLDYTTNSLTAKGGISKVRTISSGLNFEKLPNFVNVSSDSGTSAYIVPKSKEIGKIKEISILNEGFEYPSDKTLRPEAKVPKVITIKNSNTITNIDVLDGGKNYSVPPDLIIVDTETGEKFETGLLVSNLSSNVIKSVSISLSPKGLPQNIVTIKSINNTNGIGIKTAYASTSGIVTCTLVTPLSGFDVEPFAEGDKIFVEGLQKEGENGDGFNSENYGYEFFEVTNYVPSFSGGFAELEFNLVSSGFTTNPGVLKSFENNYGSIINYNNYPKFKVTQDFSNFIVGESLEVKNNINYTKEDLVVVESNKNYIKVLGTYDLKLNQVIRGSQSGSIATIDNIDQSIGQFNIDYGSIQRIGWYDNIGNLNDDAQVIADNDYYQNLSYSVKSNQEWVDIVSPVNNTIHPAGMKNFADTQITQSIKSTGIKTAIDTYTESIFDIINENRVDTINNFDLVKDVDTFNNSSKFLKFKTKKLSDYFKSISNRVLEIDDISLQFSNENQLVDTSSKIVDINPSRNYNRFLVQVANKNLTEAQFSEIIVLKNGEDTFTFERGSISTGVSSSIGYDTNTIGDIFGYSDDLGSYYLKFTPKESYLTSYDIKYLNTTFINSSVGVGTTSVGFVDLFGVTSNVSSGSTTIVLQKPTSNVESLFCAIHIVNNTTNEMNYIELFVDHDGNDVNISEFYFDTNDGLSSNFIGTFGSSIDGGILTLNYTNTSNNSVIIRSRNVGFGTTSVGIGTYRFKQSGQVDGLENTVNYDSRYSNISSESTIVELDKTKFTSLKSTIKVSIGQTSALHQVMLISDSTNVSTIQYPFLSIGSTLGIGTFGGQISGSSLELKFYPDPNISGNFEILSFNESFYRENDYTITPPNLQYANILESVGVSKYYSVNDNDINKDSFELNYNGTPIFVKTFNPANSSILNPSTGEFTIPNHFFSTGEEILYRPNSTFAGVPITSVGIGTTVLPEVVYAIKISNDVFKLSTTKENAYAGIAVTFPSLGAGNSHELEMVKKSEKSLISINNIVQEPIAYSLLNYTVNNDTQISTSSTTFALSGISSIKVNDILKIDNEYMKVINVGFGEGYSGPISFAGTFPLVNVERGFVGTSATSHSNFSSVALYRGSFNIVKNRIYFTEAPQGSLIDQLFVDIDNLPDAKAYFNGRVFLRKDYTTNKIYDNISEKFTGIGQTYRLTVGGANTVGLGTSGGSGVVFINGIFQTPTTENNPNNNFLIQEDQGVGISSIVFSGITSFNGSKVISEFDVNLNQLPRGGLIVSLGSSGGLGYAPLVGASVTAIVSGGSITGIGIGTTGTWGSGYRSPVSVSVVESGHSGTNAIITASVGMGGTLSFTITNSGTGYINPTINISPPSYSNLNITGVSRLGIGTTTECGIGLLLNVDVGASSTTGIGSTLFEVSEFKIMRSGYGFKKGDVITPVGLVTAYGLSEPISKFELTILDIFTDSFSAIQFGELDYIDSIKKYQNDTRTRFPLYYNSELLSFEKDAQNVDSQLIDFDALLIVFINGILQKPKVAYQFEGGTSFTFTEPPKKEDNISIFFYKGSSQDSQQVSSTASIKEGDDVQVFSNNRIIGVTTSQSSRIVYDITTSDTIETDFYALQGIDENNYKPISWTKQKKDKVINGYIVSKSRDTIESQIYPTSKIIKDFDLNSDEIFLDNIALFNYEGDANGQLDAIIISGNSDPVSAAVTAVVSTAGTIQSLSIVNAGSGYVGSSVSVSIASPPASIVGFGATLSVSVGTTATASISVVNGSLSTVSIINPGSGYTFSNPPQVLIPLPNPVYENITNISGIAGTSGNITGIGTTVGIGTNLALKFTLSETTDLVIGYPIYIFNTSIGNGVTSIIDTDSKVIGIGTTFLDNIYYISGISTSSGNITCNIHSQTPIAGLSTSGTNSGKFSWGKLDQFSRSSPIAIGVSGFTISSGLTTFPTIQRRGYGLRNIGPIQKNL
jgi:hypothetical protein